MSEKTNIELVRQAYAAFGKGDVPGLLRLFAGDVVWHFPECADIPWAGTFRGHEGVTQFLGILSQTADMEAFEPRVFVARSDQVVVLGHERMRAKSANRSYESHWAHSFTLGGGKIAEFREYTDTAAIVGALRGA